MYIVDKEVIITIKDNNLNDKEKALEGDGYIYINNQMEGNVYKEPPLNNFQAAYKEFPLELLIQLNANLFYLVQLNRKNKQYYKCNVIFLNYNALFRYIYANIYSGLTKVKGLINIT